MLPTRKHLGLAVLMAQAALAAGTAQAQIEEVIVTAERREASLQETDISMTVMNDQALSEMGATSFHQIGDFAPNVMMHEMPGKAGAAIAIRGFKNAETMATFEPKVALYVDGVLLAKNAGSAFDVLDIERIEILRGPQGTLYGRNTAGGAVNVITKKPTDEFGGKFGATLGNYGQQDFKGTLNVPLINNPGGSSLNMKGTLASLERDGYWDNNFLGKDVGDKDRMVGQLQLQWQLNDNFSALYAYDRTEVDETPWPVQLVDYNRTTRPFLAPYVGNGSSSKRPMDLDTWLEAEVDGHSLTLDWDINDDLSLVSITALRTMTNDALSDSDASPVFVFSNLAGDDTETFTQEVRLVGDAGDRLNYVVGAFYMDEDINDVYALNVVPSAALGPLDNGQTGSAKNENWAIFGEGTYALTEKLDLTLGLRYTEEEREMSRLDLTRVRATGAFVGTPLKFPDASGDFDDISGTLSVSYQHTDDLMTYAKVSKGYVSGGFNVRSPNNTANPFALFQKGYDEEVVWTYEIGWKSTLLDNRLMLNGAVFYNDYQDMQVNQLTEDGRNNFGNAGDAEISGLEIEFQATPIDNLDLGGGYGYLDPKYNTYIDAAGRDLSKNDWAHAPKHTLNAYIRYEVPSFQDIGDLSYRLDWSWRDDHSLLTAVGNEVEGYDFTNARIGLDNIRGPNGSTLSVALWGKNITDEVWYTSGYNLVSVLGFRANAVSAPRTFGVDFNVEF